MPYKDRQKQLEYGKKWGKINKEKKKVYDKQWRKNNKKILKEKQKNYRKQNYKQIQIEIINWRNKYPWIKSCYPAKQRCNNPKNKRYHRYGGRGIKFLMTSADFEYLWFRDKAYLMKKPSIDRINNDGNYELSNCRFIELSENIRKSNKRIR